MIEALKPIQRESNAAVHPINNPWCLLFRLRRRFSLVLKQRLTLAGSARGPPLYEQLPHAVGFAILYFWHSATQYIHPGSAADTCRMGRVESFGSSTVCRRLLARNCGMKPCLLPPLKPAWPPSSSRNLFPRSANVASTREMALVGSRYAATG